MCVFAIDEPQPGTRQPGFCQTLRLWTYMVPLSVSEELEQVSCWHEFHDDEDGVILTHAQDFHDVWVVEVAGVCVCVCVCVC